MALGKWTLDQVFNQLNSGSKWAGSSITYAFPTTISGMYVGADNEGGFKAFNSSQQAIAEIAIRLWDDLVTPTFTKVNPTSNWQTASIEMGYGATGIDYAHAYSPTKGSAWFNLKINSGYSDLVQPIIGNHGFDTFIHELGHAIGLEHMGNYDGNQASGPSNFYDSVMYSVMSYFGPGWGFDAGEGQVAWADWVGADGLLHTTQTPMINDIMAVQKIYGADKTTRATDTTYGFNSNVVGSVKSVYDFALNSNPILCIWDSGGKDTLDLSGYSTDSQIFLAPGSFSSANEMTYNISIAYNCVIENAVGGSGADTITGNVASNILTGNGSHDTLDGQDDADWLYGGTGNDTLIGGAGNDTIDGGEGTDLVVFNKDWAVISATYLAVEKAFSFAITEVAGLSKDIVKNVENFKDASGVIKNATELAAQLDLTKVGFETATQTIKEGNSGTTLASLTISLSKPEATPHSVKWVAAGSGTAAASTTDFAGTLSGTLNFAAGETSKTIQIGIAGDTIKETDETFTISLSDPTSGLFLGQSTTLVTIQDDDTVIATPGLRLIGNKRANLINGTAGDDVLDGRKGRDVLYGNDGADNLNGGAGADRLYGGRGNDSLFGGSGADTFAFAEDTGNDVISDYNDYHDVIDLSLTTIGDFTDLKTSHLAFVGNNAIISFGTSMVTIINYGLDDLSSFDFIF